MKKLWQIALEEFVDKIHFDGKPLYECGISIPMMIGIYHKAGLLTNEDLNTDKCIKCILSDILSTHKLVRITKCDKCGYNYIISEKDVDCLVGVNPNINNLIYLQLQFDGNKQSFTLQEASEKFYEEYRTAITNMKFSYNNDSWSDYTDEEKHIINIIIRKFAN